MSKLVIIESPYGAKTEEQVLINMHYARACVRDSLLRGEIPFASHLFYTQPGILDDNVLEERTLGIVAGLTIGNIFSLSAIYEDLGISKGMEYGIMNAEKTNRLIEHRKLGEDWLEKIVQRYKKHSHANIWGVNGQLK